jgi:regulator of protease activity HflC (stomatin/prohibitin superfamily)
MVNYVSILVFILVGALGALITGGVAQLGEAAAAVFGVTWLICDIILASGIKMAAQWEKALVFRMGKFSSIKGPGLFITKDNVPVRINGVLFFQVRKVDDAIIKVQDYRYAISQYAQTSLRDVIGQMTLDQLLGEREEIGRAIEANVEKDTQEWGLEVKGIRIQDIDMPEELKKMMARQASAEREKRATITKAEGDRDAAMNLAAAARTMAESPGAMQLRTLQSIDGLGPSASNTVVLAVPVDVMETFRGLSALLKDRRPVAPPSPSAGVRAP